jgi:hypothetical protein
MNGISYIIKIQVNMFVEVVGTFNVLILNISNTSNDLYSQLSVWVYQNTSQYICECVKPLHRPDIKQNINLLTGGRVISSLLFPETPTIARRIRNLLSLR